MKLFHLHLSFSFLFLLLTITSTTLAQRYAKSGCKDECGKVRIPYPFGMGARCSINKWYSVDCNSSTPYLRALNNLEILDVDLGTQTVTINASMVSDCLDPVRNNSRIFNGPDLGSSPFLFSKFHNKFVAEGCGNAVIMDINGSVVAGCSTTCGNGTINDRKSCMGLSCCKTTIPHYLKSYTMNLTGLERRHGTRGRNYCGSAFLVDDKSYVEGRYSIQAGDKSYVPISLVWILTVEDFNNEDEICYYSRYKVKLDLSDDTSVESLNCANYSISQGPCSGSPYLRDGCVASKECNRCVAKHGDCFYEDIYDGDGLVNEWDFTCIYELSQPDYNFPETERKSYLGITLGVCTSMGVLFIVVIRFSLYKVIKRTKVMRRRKRLFIHNGGLLLKQKEASLSLVDKMIHFTFHELEKATDSFNENRIIGQGSQGPVYKGMLEDGRVVVVKKSKIVDKSQLEQFINDMVIHSQVNHKNVVKLLGCCLETEIPLLVLEFISNGTLYHHIHNTTDGISLSWNMRLQIATEVARTLAYLHSMTSFPIYHKDIKTTNILLDDKYRAKVSYTGTSRFVSMDQSHLTTLIKGTLGYLDPEYFQYGQYTEKSHVYSFGVVLVELLTSERPISLTRFGLNISLASYFVLAMEEERVMSILDVNVIKAGSTDELMVIANLAMQCLNLNGKNWPTIKEIAVKLESIRMSHIPSMVHTNIGQVRYKEEFLVITD